MKCSKLSIILYRFFSVCSMDITSQWLSQEANIKEGFYDKVRKIEVTCSLKNRYDFLEPLIDHVKQEYQKMGYITKCFPNRLDSRTFVLDIVCSTCILLNTNLKMLAYITTSYNIFIIITLPFIGSTSTYLCLLFSFIKLEKV